MRSRERGLPISGRIRSSLRLKKKSGVFYQFFVSLKLSNDNLVPLRPWFSIKPYSKMPTIFNRKHHQIATFAEPNCHWRARERRKIKKNTPDFFLRRSEDLIRPKMERPRSYDCSPFLISIYAFILQKKLSQNHRWTTSPELLQCFLQIMFSVG